MRHPVYIYIYIYYQNVEESYELSPPPSSQSIRELSHSYLLAKLTLSSTLGDKRIWGSAANLDKKKDFINL